MARPSETKNIMRTPEEKERIILEYLDGNSGLHFYERKYGIQYSLLHSWYVKYQEKGITGLQSKTGKHLSPNSGKYNRHPSEEEKLKLEIAKLEIEVARLKKGYIVKGAGVKKEYVTTFDANIK